jgi:hypothetical protein
MIDHICLVVRDVLDPDGNDVEAVCHLPPA